MSVTGSNVGKSKKLKKNNTEKSKTTMIKLVEEESHANSIGSLMKFLGIDQLQCLQLFLIQEISPVRSRNQMLRMKRMT